MFERSGQAVRSARDRAHLSTPPTFLRSPQPASGDALPKSDRVTSRTSLSLIHSITVVLGTLPIDFGPLRELSLPPPLALAVFVVSTPGPNSSISSRVYDLTPVAQLVNPRLFVVRGRQPKLDSIHFRPAIVKLARGERSATSRYWNRFEIAILHGASVNLWDLIDSRASQVRHESDPPLPPLRMMVDLVSAPEKQFAISEHADYFVGRSMLISGTASRGISLKVWVGSEGSKKALEEKMKASERNPTRPVEHADVEVISERARRFRDDLGLGAWKAMDWAVLDDV